MYMFFWFFKQFYYCLRRISKSGLLLLVLFFVAFLFIFVKPSYAVNSTDIPQAVLNEANNPRIGNGGNNIILKSKSTEHYYILLSAYDLSSSDTAINGSWFYGNYVNGNNNYLGFSNPLSSRCRTYTTDDDGATWFYTKIWDSSTSNVVTLSLEYFDIVYSKTNVLAHNLDGYTNNSIVFSPTFLDPFISTSSSSIVGWNFSTLNINCGSTPVDANCFLSFTYDDNYFDVDISNYKSIINNTIFYNIPKSLIGNNIVVRNGSVISFTLTVRHNLQVLVYDLGSYALSLTSQEEEDINTDSNKQLLSNISNNQQQTTQAINNLNNTQQQTTEAIEDLNDTITNSSIDNSSIYLPSDNSNDITADGLNGIFTSIYNAFCTGQAQDIVFPIPFTNKNITLPANYVRQMLSNNGASWIITIIEAFWWYLISRFIIKDITNKITKIKSGNIEDIEDSNIKGDML